MKKSKRTILSLILVLVMLCSISVPASAAGCRTLRCQITQYIQTIACTRFGICSKPTASVPVLKPTESTPSAPAEKPVETPSAPTQTPSTPTADASDYETAVVALVNEQRAAYGLKPLALSAELCEKARLKSQDMAANRYFSHTSPTYGSPFDMMRSLGISYNTAGENIAMGYATPQAVANAWMNSEGHRANILSAKYTTIGVGYIASGNYWTQWFIG